MKARRRQRRLAADLARRLVDRFDDRHSIGLDHRPTSVLAPRYGHGRPPHARLRHLIARHDDAYRTALRLVVSYRADLLRIPLRPQAAAEPYWLNPWLPGLDAAALYAFVRERAPQRYLEVGSGVSTLFVDRARRDGSLPTEIVSIDPSPRWDVDQVCDRSLRTPLEQLDLSVFRELRGGDVVFFDGSHRVFMNSDATVFFLDVLPGLAPGVLVGVHDVFWPEDYLPQWSDWYYSEQYLLGAYLLAEAPFIDPRLAGYHVTREPQLAKLVAPLWQEAGLREVDSRGWAFWFDVRAPAEATGGPAPS